jgi:hypothetical protein
MANLGGLRSLLCLHFCFTLRLFKGCSSRRMGVAKPKGRTCQQCSLSYVNFQQHVRRHPKCRPTQLVVPEIPVKKVAVPAIASHLAGVELRSTVLWDLGGMRLERDFDAGDIQEVKQVVGRWQVTSNVLAAQQLQQAELLRPGISVEQVARAMGTDIFKGIHSGKSENSARRAESQPLVPRVTDLRGGDGKDANHLVVSFSPLDLIEQRLQRCADYRKKLIAESEQLKSGDGYRTPPPEVQLLRGYKDSAV